VTTPETQLRRVPKGYDGFLHVGVTGSRKGASRTQMQTLGYLVSMLPIERLCLHHGDCFGFDQEAWEFFCNLNIPMVVAHPPRAYGFRAFCPPRTGYPDIILPEKEYKIRDIEIVVSSRVLFAAPELPMNQAPRSGTWYTVRRGWGRGIPVFELPRGEQ
jgi:hypothetical protein